MRALPFRLPSAFFVALLSACATAPDSPDTPTPVSDRDTGLILEEPKPRRAVPVFQIQNELGMNRSAQDLGFAEKLFNACNYGIPGAGCERMLNVVHFQLMCRDSEGTVSTVPLALRPIVAPYITWSVAGQSGSTRTDRNGFGQFAFISGRTVKEKRLILRKGRQYVGLTVSEITKLVLPKNWCGRS